MIKEIFAKIDVWDFVKRNALTIGLFLYILSVSAFSGALLGILAYLSSLICYSVIASQFVLFAYTKTRFDDGLEVHITAKALIFLSVSILIGIGSWIKFADVL